ncbi:hypothetical protein B7P43_G09332 [Cryptotermes secundus]|uniref:Uncharacterized protein n=1 Tax=Cryptotermes secundus TaxID=105785 RepID=A0A2J7QTB3_9NEOP|nr:hypothetical protein B7P43_G09332 [Cryptotermes secundus]
MKMEVFKVDIIHAPFRKLSELGAELTATSISLRDVFLVVNQRPFLFRIAISNKTIRTSRKRK